MFVWPQNPSSMPPIYRFGLFEVNPTTRQVLRNGIKIRLQEQPFRVLLYLLESPGQVLTREQLRQNLWSGDIFVEFDNSLRVAVGKLRDALGDDADNPRFVETVPRLGYRFIAPVHVSATEPASPTPEDPDFDRSTSQAIPAREVEVPAPIRRRPGKILLWAFSVATLLLITISLAAWKMRNRPVQTLNETDATLISTFANYTGDAVFEGILKQVLTVKLNESPFLNLVPDARVIETLRYMKLSSGAQLTPDVWREVCQRTNAKAMLTGTIAPVGAQYLIGLEAIDCRTGDVLVRDQVQAENKEGVLNALNHSADELRVRLGESLRSIAQFDTPIQEATTGSLEALKSWNLGVLAAKAGEERSGIPLLTRATELDPNFASAYNELGITFYNVGEMESARSNFQKAFELRQRASERERLNIESRYYQFATGDLDKAIAVLQTWKRTYPRDAIPPGDLGAIYLDLGGFRQDIDESLEALRRMPNNFPAYQHLAIGYLGTNNLEQGFANHQKEIANWESSPFAHANLYAIAFVRADAAAMNQETTSAPGKADRQEAIFTSQALVALFGGRLQQAGAFFERAIAAAEEDKSPDQAAYIGALRAQMEAEVGEYGPARKHAREALAKSKDIGATLVAAVALARAGEAREAKTIVGRLSREYPQHTVIQKIALPTISATAAIGDDPAKALKFLGQTLPYELGMMGSIVPLNLSNPPLCPAYVRGRAYLESGDANRATVEFQKILDHRGVYMISPYYSLAYLGLARALALQGNANGARDSYDRFFFLWKDSDRSIPVLREARQEYAKLRVE